MTTPSSLRLGRNKLAGAGGIRAYIRLDASPAAQMNQFQ